MALNTLGPMPILTKATHYHTTLQIKRRVVVTISDIGTMRLSIAEDMQAH